MVSKFQNIFLLATHYHLIKQLIIYPKQLPSNAGFSKKFQVGAESNGVRWRRSCCLSLYLKYNYLAPKMSGLYVPKLARLSRDENPATTSDPCKLLILTKLSCFMTT